MRRYAIIGLIPFVLLICSTSFTSGQTILPLVGTEYGIGIRALGMGGAFVGLANDYSASYWNPAGLGQGRDEIRPPRTTFPAECQKGYP